MRELESEGGCNRNFRFASYGKGVSPPPSPRPLPVVNHRGKDGGCDEVWEGEGEGVIEILSSASYSDLMIGGTWPMDIRARLTPMPYALCLHRSVHRCFEFPGHNGALSIFCSEQINYYSTNYWTQYDVKTIAEITKKVRLKFSN